MLSEVSLHYTYSHVKEDSLVGLEPATALNGIIDAVLCRLA